METNHLHLNITVTNLDTNEIIVTESKQCTLINTVNSWIVYTLKKYRRLDRSIQFKIINLKTNEEVQFAKVS